jgi:alkylation response protein AidB-like acyl-CoA dehydrogenase
MRKKVSNIATDIWTAHLMTFSPAEMKDGGDNSLNQASMAQYFVSEAACKVAGETTSIFGAFSNLMEYWPKGSYCHCRFLVSRDGASKILQTISSREKVVL